MKLDLKSLREDVLYVYTIVSGALHKGYDNKRKKSERVRERENDRNLGKET